MLLLYRLKLASVKHVRYCSQYFSAMAPHLKIGTHNGCFHCDEVLACYMLKKLPEYENAEIIRSRTPTILDTCDIVVDVGAVYDHSKKRYDHHQHTFDDTLSKLRPTFESSIKLSSAGLIYHHYGERVIEAIIGKSLNKELLNKLFKFVYDSFIQEVDAIDNGVTIGDNQRYKITTHLSARISHLNPSWTDENSGSDVEFEQFTKAMDLAGSELTDCINRFYKYVWPAREIVRKALDERSGWYLITTTTSRISTYPDTCPDCGLGPQFKSRSARDEFLKKRNTGLVSNNIIEGSDNEPIFINVNLSSHNRDLFWRAREAKRKLNYKFCWVNPKGDVYLRKNEDTSVLLIKSLADLPLSSDPQ